MSLGRSLPGFSSAARGGLIVGLAILAVVALTWRMDAEVKQQPEKRAYVRVEQKGPQGIRRARPRRLTE